jgi:integrase
MRYPAGPPTVEEIVTVMRRAGGRVHGRRLRGVIVVLWRAGLRIHEARALAEADLDPRRGSLLVCRGLGRPASRGRDGRLGLGAARVVGDRTARAAGRVAGLRRQRPDAWTAVVGRRGPLPCAPASVR